MELFLSGVITMFTPFNLLIMVVGVVVGLIFGAIPGLTGTMAIALCLPMTFGMDPVGAFGLLLSLYIGGISGGLVSAILINIPGTPSSVATTFDGSPMAKKGEAGKALGVATFYSLLGNLIGVAVMIFMTPPLADIALKFGVYEYFSISILSLCLVAGLAGRSMSKGLVSCAIGMILACVGAAPIDGFARYTFGISGMESGFSLVPALVGLFALKEVLAAARPGGDDFELIKNNTRIKGLGFSLKEFIENIPNMIRSALIGVWIGILPGIGSATSNIMAYGVAQKTSKHPEKFGTGIMDGVVASETSNNACIGGNMVPLLALGIPGDAVTGILLGTFTIHGLQPGPLFFSSNYGLVYTIFAAMVLASIITFFVEFFGMRAFIKVLKFPKYFLLPVVMVLCMVGSFGVNNNMFDAWVLLIFGLIGFGLSHFGYPLAPVIMGFIMGPITELYLRRGLQLSRGSFLPFFTRPISGAFLVITILFIAYTAIKGFKVAKEDLDD
jgi:putative tricarboxylic transport membrane protein